MVDDVVLRLSRATKTFGPVIALAEGDIEVRRGEIHALLGENGAGKSTLVKVLAGLHRPDSGELEVAGELVQFRSVADSKAVGMQPDRVMDALNAIDRIERRVGMQHHLPIAVDRAPAGGEQFLNVRLLDLVSAKLDLDVGDIADQAARGEARPDIVDGHSADPLGDLDRFANGDLASLHVGDITAFDPATFALAGAEHAESPVRVAGHDQSADLGRADVECGNQGLVGNSGHYAEC